MRTRLLVALLSLVLGAGCQPEADDDVSADDDATEGDDDTSVGDDDDDTDVEIEQGPVTFTVVNGADEPRYFPWLEWWSDDINAILACARSSANGWEPCLFGLPFEAEECLPELEGEDCTGGIDSGPAVYVLPPGGTLDIVWPGALWHGDPDHCAEGVCYRPGATYEGRYGATVLPWDDVICIQGDCPDPGAAGGVIWGAAQAGSSASFHVEFDLPYTGDPLSIPIE